MAQKALIPSGWELPEEFTRRLGTIAGRQRAMQAEGHLLLVLHEVPEHGEDSRRGVLFHRDPSGLWKSSNGESGALSLERHLDSYTKRLDTFDLLEQQAQRSTEYLKLLEGLAPVVRATRHMLEVFEEVRKLLPNERRLIDCRDRAYEICRRADLLYDEGKNSMEVAVVRRAEEQSAASHQMLVTAHRLNVLAALLFPFATLGSIFGTTLTDNWSWSKDNLGFFIFLAASCISGAILAVLISRPTK